MTKINTDSLNRLLENAVNNKNVRPALWRLLLKDLDRIEAAKIAGESYKNMADAMGVTAHSFSIAMKKAREYLSVQQGGEKAKIEEITKKKAPPISALKTQKTFKTTTDL